MVRKEATQILPSTECYKGRKPRERSRLDVQALPGKIGPSASDHRLIIRQEQFPIPLSDQLESAPKMLHAPTTATCAPSAVLSQRSRCLCLTTRGCPTSSAAGLSDCSCRFISVPTWRQRFHPHINNGFAMRVFYASCTSHSVPSALELRSDLRSLQSEP